jgi:two-component system, response regulator PdtaR
MDIRFEAGRIDGIEAAQEIRRRLGLRSVFFSGYSDARTRERAAAAEPLAFVDKTASRAELARVISAAVVP